MKKINPKQAKKKTVAMVIPNKTMVQSETFIEAQKNLIDAHIKLYCKGIPPMMLNGKHLTGQNILKIAQIEILRRLKCTPLVSILEAPVAASFAREKIEVVLAQFGTSGVGILNVCKMLKLPLIVHFHGYDASVKEVLATNEYSYKQMFEYATYIIAVSKSMQQRLIDLGAPAHKVIYNPYGPNDVFFSLRQTETKKLFVGAGRFTDKKAPYYTILAFQKVLHNHPDAQLILAGTGELWDVCRNLVNYLGLSDKVRLPGVFTHSQLMQWFSEAAAFVQHSLTPSSGDMEGTPVVILEASAAGLPVVSTRHAGIPDVIIDGITGLLVDEYDVTSMAECMCKILDEPENARKMGVAGRNNMKENYSMKRHIDTLTKLIDKC